MNRPPPRARLSLQRPVQQLAVAERAGAAVVQVRADIDAALADSLRLALTDAVRRRGNVVLDLSEAPTIDPTGLGVVVRAHREARQHDCLVCFVAPSRFVLTVLHTMRLECLFPIFDDCPSALQWLTQDGAVAAWPSGADDREMSS